jgi:hypothetical protein
MDSQPKEQGRSSVHCEQIRCARDMLQPRQTKELPAFDKDVSRDHDWPIPTEYLSKAEKQMTDDPASWASSSFQPPDKAARLFDPYTRVQAIRKRTGYEARIPTSSQYEHPSSTPIIPRSPERERTESDQRPPPIPVKPRREVAQDQSPITLVQEDNRPAAWSLALHEETQAVSVIVPDDPAPMYTELPVEHVVPIDISGTDAHVASPSDGVRISSNTPERKEAVERMDDMEEEITCPM